MVKGTECYIRGSSEFRQHKIGLDAARTHVLLLECQGGSRQYIQTQRHGRFVQGPTRRYSSATVFFLQVGTAAMFGDGMSLRSSSGFEISRSETKAGVCNQRR